MRKFLQEILTVLDFEQIPYQLTTTETGNQF